MVEFFLNKSKFSLDAAYISGKFEGIILSTGASNIEDCRRAVEIFKDNELVILHCLSEYPAPIDEINLRYKQNVDFKDKLICIILKK